MPYSNIMPCLLVKRNGNVPTFRRDYDNSAERWEGWSKIITTKQMERVVEYKQWLEGEDNQILSLAVKDSGG